MKDDEFRVTFEDTTRLPIRLKTYGEYEKTIRNNLLSELVEIFENTIHDDWKNWEVVDFLNSYKESK